MARIVGRVGVKNKTKKVILYRIAGPRGCMYFWIPSTM